jgi:hypothetical protein
MTTYLFEARDAKGVNWRVEIDGEATREEAWVRLLDPSQATPMTNNYYTYARGWVRDLHHAEWRLVGAFEPISEPQPPPYEFEVYAKFRVVADSEAQAKEAVERRMRDSVALLVAGRPITAVFTGVTNAERVRT